jgi:GNAT superfamily N-acetyltransferase
MFTKKPAVQLNAVNHAVSLDQLDCPQVIPHNKLLRTPEWYAGFNKLRQQSANDSKLGDPKAVAFVDPEIHEVTKLANKQKWMQSFKKAYSGGIILPPLSAYDPENSRMFIAKLGKKELGFIRITNYTDKFKEVYGGEVWNIGEIYVKSPYRSQGISSILIKYVLRCCNVKLILLETERYEENHHYFERHGFTFHLMTNDGLSRIFLDDFKSAVIRRIAYVNKQKILKMNKQFN